MPTRKEQENLPVSAYKERWIIDPKYKNRSSFTIRETAEILGISRWHAWNAAKRGDLPVVSIGRRKIVPRVRLERLMNGE
jgi:hypothetical protein